MTDTVLSLLSDFGPLILFFATLASCFGIPIPATLTMLGAGALSASSDLSITLVVMAALLGALVGDQLGYWLGRAGSGLVEARLVSSPGRAALLERARSFTCRWGSLGVFLSRWLVSPLGPWINLTGGAAGMSWGNFTLWGGLGEIVWVAIYLGLGFFFSTSLTALAAFLADAVWFLAGATITAGLGYALFRISRKRHSRAGAENAT